MKCECGKYMQTTNERIKDCRISLKMAKENGNKLEEEDMRELLRDEQDWLDRLSREHSAYCLGKI